MAKSDKHVAGTNNGNGPAIADGAKPIDGSVSAPIQQSEPSGNNNAKIGGDGITPSVASGANDTIRDPAIDGGTPAPKRRGRPPGSTGKSKPGTATVLPPEKGLAVRNDRAKMFQQIAGIHQGAALLTGVQVFALNDQEAKMLSDALCDVLDHYGITLGGPAGVWMGLITAAGVVYGPRYMMIKQLQKGIPPRGAMPATPGAVGMKQTPMNFAGDVSQG